MLALYEMKNVTRVKESWIRHVTRVGCDVIMRAKAQGENRPVTSTGSAVMRVIRILFTNLHRYYDDIATLAIKNATLCGRYYSLALSLWRRRLSASRIYNIPPLHTVKLSQFSQDALNCLAPSPPVSHLSRILGPGREIVCYCRDCQPWIGWNEFFEFKLLAKLFPLA